MPATFPIQHDHEFYVFLKSSLPARFRIEAAPSAAYYSEWAFHYELYDEDVLLQTFEGDFLTLEKGKLVQEALKLLEILEAENEKC